MNTNAIVFVLIAIVAIGGAILLYYVLRSGRPGAGARLSPRTGHRPGCAFENVCYLVATFLVVHGLVFYLLVFVPPISGRVEDGILASTLAWWKLLAAGAAVRGLSLFGAPRNYSSPRWDWLTAGSWLGLVLALGLGIGHSFGWLSEIPYVADQIQGVKLAEGWLMFLGQLVGTTKAVALMLAGLVVATLLLSSEFGGGRVRSALMLATEEAGDLLIWGGLVLGLVYGVIVLPVSILWGWIHGLRFEETWLAECWAWWPFLALGALFLNGSLVAAFRREAEWKMNGLILMAGLCLIANLVAGGFSAFGVDRWLVIRELAVFHHQTPGEEYADAWSRYLLVGDPNPPEEDAGGK